MIHTIETLVKIATKEKAYRTLEEIYNLEYELRMWKFILKKYKVNNGMIKIINKILDDRSYKDEISCLTRLNLLSFRTE